MYYFPRPPAWMHILTCNENSYSEGNSCATAPTASSATLMQSARESDTIRGVKQAHRPASVISLHPASSSSNSDCKQRQNVKNKYEKPKCMLA